MSEFVLSLEGSSGRVWQTAHENCTLHSHQSYDTGENYTSDKNPGSCSSVIVPSSILLLTLSTTDFFVHPSTLTISRMSNPMATFGVCCLKAPATSSRVAFTLGVFYDGI
eukprot:4945636-Amphidinium_carterae.1